MKGLVLSLILGKEFMMLHKDIKKKTERIEGKKNSKLKGKFSNASSNALKISSTN